MTNETAPIEWDAFVSYASEDRAEVAQPLSQALTTLGLRIWFDRTELRVGDSLRERIDSGLALSRFGIVILSPAFFGKHYPVRELNGLAQREVAGEKVLLPVWYGVTVEEVRKFSPPLADRVAAQWSDGLEAVVAQLFQIIGQQAIEEARAAAAQVHDLPQIQSGTELLEVMTGSHAHSMVHDEFANTNDVNEVGDFLQSVEELVDGLDEFGAGDRARLSFAMTGTLARLKELGWKVFAAKIREPMPHGVTGDWYVSCVAVVHSSRRRVARVGQQFLVVKSKDDEQESTESPLP